MIQGLPPELDLTRLPDWLQDWYSTPTTPKGESAVQKLKDWIKSGHAPSLLVKATLLFYNGDSPLSIAMVKALPANMIDEEVVRLCLRSSALSVNLIENPNFPDSAARSLEEIVATWLEEGESSQVNRALHALYQLAARGYGLSERTYKQLAAIARQWQTSSDAFLALDVLRAARNVPEFVFHALAPIVEQSHAGQTFLAEHPNTPLPILREIVSKLETISDVRILPALIKRQDCLKDLEFRRMLLSKAWPTGVEAILRQVGEAEDIAFVIQRYLKEGDIDLAKSFLEKYMNGRVLAALGAEAIAQFFMATDSDIREWALVKLAPRLAQSGNSPTQSRRRP